MQSNKKEAPTEPLNKNHINIITPDFTKCQDESAPAILIREWTPCNWDAEDENLIRLYLISRKNAFYLKPVTQAGYYGNHNDREYQLNGAITQIQDLTASEARQLYYDAEKQHMEAC